MTDKIKKPKNGNVVGSYNYWNSMVSDTTFSDNDRAFALWERSQLKTIDANRGNPDFVMRQKPDKYELERNLKTIKNMDLKKKKIKNIANTKS